MILYDERKHLNLDTHPHGGTRRFKEIDFSKAEQLEIQRIFKSNRNAFVFESCKFKNLDLSWIKEFSCELQFIECAFKNNSNFENIHFKNNVSFEKSEFNGITNFKNAIFIEDAIFSKIKTTGQNGNFIFSTNGQEVNKNADNYYKRLTSFEYAVFNTEVSFLKRDFGENVTFQWAKFLNKFWFTETKIGLKSNFHMLEFSDEYIQDIDKCYRILCNMLIEQGSDIAATVIKEYEKKAFDIAENGKLKFLEPTQDENNEKKWLNTKDAADFLGQEVSTLAQWRYQQKGPKFTKIAGTRQIRYLKSDLDDFLSNK